MAEGRGKKPKKARWQFSLGIVDVIFAGIGLVGLLAMSFALGTLAGRGDIYRVMHNWGLVEHEAIKIAAHTQPPSPNPGPGQPTAQEAPPEAAPPPGQPTTGSHIPLTPPPAPQAVKGTPPQTAHPAAAPAKKKGKETPSAKERQAKEEELKRLRQEVAKISKFQNKMESQPPKPPGQTAKEKTAPKLTKVAMFRNGAKAKEKLAELQRKGEKVTLKEGKDQEGPYFTIYRQVPAKPQETKSARKPASGQAGQ